MEGLLYIMAETSKEPPKMKPLEAKAVDRAKATADAVKPPLSILNAKTAEPLMKLVDGPALGTYDTKESVYVGRSIPVLAGKSLVVPIQVAVPGSIVDYSIEISNYDIGLSIDAERNEGITIVKEMTRLTASDSPLKQTFLVGTIPCMIKFSFSNDYSWMREKLISYKITVTPPSRQSVLESRRTRAATCLKVVQSDMQNVVPKIQSVQKKKAFLAKQVEELKKQLDEKQKDLEAATKEENTLKERKALREEQERLLNQRLKSGWEDEAKGKKT